LFEVITIKIGEIPVDPVTRSFLELVDTICVADYVYSVMCMIAVIWLPLAEMGTKKPGMHKD
jgi:hypothetical protein